MSLISLKGERVSSHRYLFNQLDRERKDLARGLKPRGHRDFQWNEDELDFPSLYGR
jgi:hypothetical protein